ncbi:type II secretion system protein GspC [Alteromonas sp. 5E99-2]|uniref:type II secretion system protein GspC n=1 Tax=Alteromonas sp. 5E99-2 TaxID=2817683 RepID=UPI001A998EB7|nr:type II secretion system protein GspC [Alteromonas sp. 5E99-2]MBO1256826.1 type II secretion system protein GspC [Alteromonas sp. 5E99-2]
MTVDKLNLQLLTLYVSQYQRHINRVIVVVLVLYLLALSADLIWRIIPEPQPSSQNISEQNGNRPSVKAGSTSSSAILRSLQQLNLFGDAVQVEVQEQDVVQDAPETSLNLVLAGVVASSSPEFGAAIIESKGTQYTYGVGDDIEGTKATLKQVNTDRVIIRNRGRDETLMLEGIDFDNENRNGPRTRDTVQAPVEPRKPNRSKPNKASKLAPVSKTEKPRLSQESIAATQKLRGSPDSFIDFISIAPQRENNTTVGYRVSPGKDPALFNAVGLKRGDVIKQINGLDVTDPSQTIEALGVLRKADTIELTISRKDETLSLFLELPEASDS